MTSLLDLREDREVGEDRVLEDQHLTCTQVAIMEVHQDTTTTVLHPDTTTMTLTESHTIHTLPMTTMAQAQVG